MNGHTILWSSPSPLWGRFRDSAGDASFGVPDQSRPAILRFATDEFMEQLLSTLASEPRQLGALVVRPETWRSPADTTPSLIERTSVPTIARGLARLRKNQLAVDPLEPTVFEKELDEPHIARAVKPKLPLKLYQPAHQRYYLVAANLVCAQTGFPDRALATNGHDQVGFVLRRLLKPKTAPGGPAVEFAFVKDDAGILWRQVRQDASESDPAARLEDGEELLPLFPLNFRDDVHHPRRLLTGMIPVGRREEYMSSRALHLTADGTPESAGPAGTDVTSRKEQFKAEVSEPWKNVIRTAYRRAQTIIETPAPNSSDEQKAITEVNDQLQGQSWLLLLDFADYLSLHVPRVWKCVVDAPDKPLQLEPGEQRLVDWLNTNLTGLPGASWPITRGTPTRPFAANLRDALKRIRESEAVRSGLEGATRLYPGETPNHPWPDFLYLLAGIRDSKEAAGIHTKLASVPGVSAVEDDDLDAAAQHLPKPAIDKIRDVEDQAATLDKLVQLVIGAFHPSHAAAAPPVPFAVQLRDALKTTNGDPGWFVLRCVYLRPNCGALHPAVLSARSQQFQLASFFDPDAPARPIRIALPLDTTAAGLRKFNKNTAFMISDTLCGQLNAIKGISFGDLVLSVLPWPFYKPLDVGKDGIAPCVSGTNSLGMICTLSIPYITIIALILMFMIALVLELIFHWIPWFIFCFPLPGFKAKRNG